jgi:hypothetical protein
MLLKEAVTKKKSSECTRYYSSYIASASCFPLNTLHFKRNLFGLIERKPVPSGKVFFDTLACS